MSIDDRTPEVQQLRVFEGFSKSLFGSFSDPYRLNMHASKQRHDLNQGLTIVGTGLVGVSLKSGLGGQGGGRGGISNTITNGGGSLVLCCSSLREPVDSKSSWAGSTVSSPNFRHSTISLALCPYITQTKTPLINEISSMLMPYIK